MTTSTVRILAGLGGLLLLLFSVDARAAYANVCVANAQNPPTNLVNVQSSSYCELCGYGFVDVLITNPYRAGTNASDGNLPYETRTTQQCSGPPWNQTCVDVVESRRNPDYGSQNPALNFNSGNSLTITLNNGLERYTGATPVIPGGGSVSGTTSITVSGMSNLAPGQTRMVRIPVHRRPDNTPESLYNTSPQATATINYTMADGCNDNPGRRRNWRNDQWYSGSLTGQFDFWDTYVRPANQHTGTVNIRQPQLSLNKQGWNYDIGQREGTRSQTVYGHNDDDIVWRLNIANTGNAPLQDLRIDDVLSRADVMNAHYVCPTAGAANNIAANNGVPPGGSPCVPTDALTGTILSNWNVAPPFGAGINIPQPYAATVNAITPGVAAGAIDIAAGGSTNIYITGKLQGNASCSSGDPMRNRLNDVQFGCAVQSPPGGILQSAGLNADGFIRSWYGQGHVGPGSLSALQVTRNLTGIDGSSAVGARGLMTVTLSNQSGGTVWFDEDMAYHLRNVLPDGYVVDPSYVPRIDNPSAGSLYGAYAGRIDTLTWLNPQGVIPGDINDSTSYLDNTAPEFRLSSSTSYTETNPGGAYNTGRVYRDLMRHGDVVVIRFAIILKDPRYYDLAADLDVIEENPGVMLEPPRTNVPTDPPALPSTLNHTLSVQARTLCASQSVNYTLQGNGTSNSPTNNTAGSPIVFDAEDLDVSIDQATFILTNDRSQHTPLSVTVENNGGVAARDFSTFITFGATMNVVTATPPPGYQCEPVPITGAGVPQPQPYRVWVVNPSPDAPGNLHMPLPGNGTVYRCYPNQGNPLNRNLAPGASVQFNFTVNKTEDPAGILADDLTFRADVVGEIFSVGNLTLPATNISRANTGGGTNNIRVTGVDVSSTATGITNAHNLWFPAPGTPGNTRTDGEVDRGNNYSLDAHWSRGIGFNLKKDAVTAGDTDSGGFGGLPTLGHCNENSDAVSYAAANDYLGQARPAEHVQIGEECTVRIQTGGWFGFESRGFNFIGVRDIQVLDEVPAGQNYISSTSPLITPQIAGATQVPNDPVAAALGDGIFGWRFTGNQIGTDGLSDYISSIDEWFTINTTTRVLNEALNDRAGPNLHAANSPNVLNSSFQATFFNNNTGQHETYLFGYGEVGQISPIQNQNPPGSSTVGYPNEPIRRVDLVVTEPLIEVTMQVCDETRHGVGEACSEFVDEIPDAATSNSYVYRLTVSNRAADDGQPRAPAYDLTVTSILDDLLQVMPLESDGLDNDGDGRLDGADAGGEGEIIGNVMFDGNETQVIFRHEEGVDGTGLRRLEAGQSLSLYYRVNPDDRIAPGQSRATRFSVTYDSLEGSTNEHGNQTVVTPGTGERGGARVYESDEADTLITFIEPEARPKEIIALSETPLVVTGMQDIKIGEEVEYRLTAELPVTLLRDLTVTDTLPAGLQCAEAPVVDLSLAPWDVAGFKRPDLSPVPPVTPLCDGNQVRWEFGDVTLTDPSPGSSRFTFPLTFIARVDNSAANQDGTVLTNGSPATVATLTWVDSQGATQTRSYGEVSATVTEPDVSLTKAWDAPDGLDAGDEITITLTATNDGSAAAYNLRLWDNLDGSGMTFLPGSVGGTDPPDAVDTSTFGANQPVFVWAPENPLAAGDTRTMTFQVRVDDTVQPLQILDNQADAAWTSLPGQDTALNSGGQIGADGAADGQRIGVLPHAGDAINDYETRSNSVDATIAAVTVSKTDLSPGVLPEIGAHKQFEIVINLPEGTTEHLRVDDLLASGSTSYVLTRDANFDVSYQFEGIVSINGSAPDEAALVAVPGDGASGTAVWDLGTVLTESENDLPVAGPLNPSIRITYFARINNDTETSAGDTLQNTLSVSHRHGEDASTVVLDDTTAAITAIESALVADKALTNLSGGQLIAGSLLEYAVTLTNQGNATAYDLNIVDTLPAGLEFEDSFTPTVTIGGAPVAGFVATPDQDGNGRLVWGRENNDGSLDLPAGQALVLTYRVIVTQTGGPFTNTVAADWTSLQGESPYQRTGDGCPVVTAPDIYCVTAQSTSDEATDNTDFTKLYVSDSWTGDGSNATDRRLRVGDTLVYRLAVTLNEGSTRNVRLLDTLPEGMAFVELVQVNGVTSEPFVPSAPFSHDPVSVSVAGQDITITLGDVVNAVDNDPGNDVFVVDYRAEVVTDVLPHQNSLDLTNQARMLHDAFNGEPMPPLPGSDQISVNQPLLSTLEKTERNGLISPYDVISLASDIMQFRLHTQNDGDAPAYSVQIVDELPAQLDETSLTAPQVSVGGALLGAADYVYTPPASRGDRFTVLLNVPVMPGDSVTVDYDIRFYTDVPPNQQWHNSATLYEYWSLPDASGQRYAPEDEARFTMQNPVTLAGLDKTLVTPTDKITIGEQVTYRITVPGEPLSAALDDVQVLDVLDDALEFVSATIGGGLQLIDNGSSGQQVDLTISQIPAGQQAEITLVARVRNIATVQAGDTFTNSASYVFGGDTLSSLPTDPLTVAEPQLSLAKNATPPATLSAGAVIGYSLQLTAQAGPDASDAHDLVLVDTLDAGLSYVPGSATPGEPVVSIDTDTGREILTWTFASLAEGDSLTVSYDTTIQDSVAPGQILINTATLRWTSLPGDDTGQRDGSETPPWNDYVVTADAEVTVDDNTGFSKVRVSDTWNSADDTLRVGDRVRFALRLALQEGTYPNVRVTDLLPTGLIFEDVVSADFFGTPGSVNAELSGAQITFDLGDVTRPAGSGDMLEIIYEARVQNESVLSHQPTQQTLSNSATLEYGLPSGPATPLTAEATLEVLQPLLAITSVTADNAEISAGQSVTLTVDITNTGDAPAYDLQVQDQLPAGLREQGVNTVAISLLSGSTLPLQTPTYDPATGTVLWNLDGAADAWTIPMGDTLRLVYEVTGDAGLGAGLTLENSVTLPFYYSFDNGAVPSGGQAEERQEYSFPDASSATLSTPLPVALDKDITQDSAAIGEPFAYRITVPAQPASTALYDVRILDDLSLSEADLQFVSVSRVGAGSWTPINVGSGAQLDIVGDGDSITIPAGEQITVEIVVALRDSATNVAGLVFHNRAGYRYNALQGDDSTTADGGEGVSPEMTIVEPDTLVLNKTGPDNLYPGQQGSFVLTLENTSAATAWDITLIDLLPDLAQGGLCEQTPQVVAVEVAGTVLADGTDYQVSYTDCQLTVNALTPDAALAPGQVMTLTYHAWLDNDTAGDQTLTNVAGATRWYSQPASADERRVYEREVTDGSVGVADHEDAHSLVSEGAELQIEKRVVNVTSGQDPGTQARPGDTLRYDIVVTNVSAVPVSSFDILDDLGALNADPVFVSGSLNRVSPLPDGASDLSEVNGGTFGSGLLDIRDLVLAAQGETGDSVTVSVEVQLAPVIANGTEVLNQAAVSSFGVPLGLSDDPNVSGEQQPTVTLISAAPQWRVEKVSTYLDDDPDVLMAGETLRYTLTVENIGSEHAHSVRLRDPLPAFTSYVAGSTTLNGQSVADVGGVSPLQNGMLVHAPGNPVPGVMEAGAADNVAVITFVVRVNDDTLDGTVISNQGFVTGEGEGSGPFEEAPSDDPGTSAPNDPTRDIVGNLPFLTAIKTVAIEEDFGTPGVVDPGDVLRYTIVVINSGAQPATDLRFIDGIPEHTTYVTGSSTLNGASVTDIGGTSPWVSGSPIQGDGAPPATLPGQETAVITFAVRVDDGTAEGTVISNQGQVTSAELPTELTDADGDRSNGYQPTEVVVGSGQQLLMTKSVQVVGGGAVEAGQELEYTVTVRNTGLQPIDQLVITDDLNALLGLADYVAGSATLNGSSVGIDVTGNVITIDYGATFGELAPNAVATLRFRVRVADDAAIGERITNTAEATWNTPSQQTEASVSVDVGGIPGTATLNGNVWHDVNFDRVHDSGEMLLADWVVEVYRAGNRIGATSTDNSGAYRLAGLAPGVTEADRYELRFRAPGAGPDTAMLGLADSPFSNSLQRISEIEAGSGSNIQALNLPIHPNGVIYDAITRQPVPGTTLTLLNSAGMAVPDSCLDDPAQQGQVTTRNGFYKFDLNFSQPGCAAGDYVIEVTPPGGDEYVAGVSQIITPLTTVDTAAYEVSLCSDDAVPATSACEVQASALQPPQSVAANSPLTGYHLHLTFSAGAIPEHSQIFNNHIPVDPVMDDAVSISKVASIVNVSRGQFVPYVIRIRNSFGTDLNNVAILDTFPAGFRYVADSARLNGEPVVPVQNGRQLLWSDLDLAADAEHTLTMLFIVGSGVSEGEYTNRAQVLQQLMPRSLPEGFNAVSGEATATVRVVPDPDFDCTDVIGRVFDDANLNGYQDEGEAGLAGVRLVTARGLHVTTDSHGRFHITCAAVPNENRGSNFILKVDDRTLPSGYRLTTENPLVQRATRGKMIRFNFGAALHRVVGLDLANDVFEPDSTTLRPQWQSRLPLLMRELEAGPSVLRLAYMAETENRRLVERRLRAIKRLVGDEWAERENPYELTIETEVFWRTGAPPARSRRQ